ncbi:Alpha/Beta hydrolase protein [Aspergillus californicus]
MVSRSLVLLLLSTLAAAGPSVTVLNGTYEGYSLPASRQDVFLGLPYAQPPLGSLRFRGPQSLNTTWSGARPAVEYSDGWYLQADPGYPISEDCLTLNVVRPNTGGGNSSLKLPVAVWIHGGGLYSGSSRATNLTNFVSQGTASNNAFIAVSINYRLSAFGFLAGSDEDSLSANNGLRDQRLALAWIQENIGFFGGDARKVTIFGESSGGLSVGKQLIAYGGRDDGLFRAAIMQSGGMAEKWPYNIKDPVVYTRGLYTNLTDATGCAGSCSPLECLRGLPLPALSAALNLTDTPVFSGTGLGPWLTQVDGDFLTDGPTESLTSGRFVPVPIIYTTMTDEATVFGFVDSVDTASDFRSFIAAGGPDAETTAVIENMYAQEPGLPAGWTPTASDLATYGAYWKRSVAFHTDVTETCSRRQTLNSWTKAGGTAYSARINILDPASAARLGSSHGVDVDYVFDNVDESADGLRDMATLMSRVWASFVVHLDPNFHRLRGAPVWPAWNGSAADCTVGSNFVFNTNGSVESRSYLELDDYRLEQTRYLSSVMQSQMYY